MTTWTDVVGTAYIFDGYVEVGYYVDLTLWINNAAHSTVWT